MIQLAEATTLATPRTAHVEPYFPDDTINLTHSERMRLYTSVWFDLGCVAFLLLLLFAALFI